MTDTHQALRDWAKGSYPSEAATELLLRGFEGRFAQPGREWILNDDWGHLSIDFEAIPENLGGLSGREERFLRIVASLSGACEVNLADNISGLDRKVLDLVLAAIAHAGGSHEHVEVIIGDDGTGTYSSVGTLHAWPDLPAKARGLRVVKD